MAEEPNDVSYKNNKHIQRISVYKTKLTDILLREQCETSS